MTYNPDIHHRRSIRLRDYDYSQNGAYFLTFCIIDRGCYFDQFPQLREIVINEWNNIPERFDNVELDEYVIMPNHFHGTIILRDAPCGHQDALPVGAVPCARPVTTGPPQGDAPTLGTIVGAFKSLCVNAWLRVILSESH